MLLICWVKCPNILQIKPIPDHGVMAKRLWKSIKKKTVFTVSNTKGRFISYRGTINLGIEDHPGTKTKDSNHKSTEDILNCGQETRPCRSRISSIGSDNINIESFLIREQLRKEDGKVLYTNQQFSCSQEKEKLLKNRRDSIISSDKGTTNSRTMEPSIAAEPAEERVSLREKNLNIDGDRRTYQKIAHTSLKRHSSSSPASRLKTQKSVADSTDSHRRSTAFEITKSILTKSRSSSPNSPRKHLFTRTQSKNDSGKHSVMAKCLGTNSIKRSKFRLGRSFSDSSEDIIKNVPNTRRTNSDNKIKSKEDEILSQSLQFLESQGVKSKSSKINNTLLKIKSASLNRRRFSEMDNSQKGGTLLRRLSKSRKQKRASLPDYNIEEVQPTKPEMNESQRADLQNRRRDENTVYLCISEAKGVPNNKSYNCLVFIEGRDRPVFKTSSRYKEDVLMWGESTEINVEEPTVRIKIQLFKKVSEDKKKKIGEVTTDPMLPSPLHNSEKWLPLTTDKPEKEAPSIRIKYRLERASVLPLNEYKDLRKVIKEEAALICEILEPILAVKQKKEVAKILVNIMQCEGKATPFLNSLMLAHVKTMGDNDAVLFRGNSIGSAAMEAYMRLVGSEYLKETLSPTVDKLIEDQPIIELNSQDGKQIDDKELYIYVDHIWKSIRNSARYFPVELRQVFYSLREQMELKKKSHLTDRLISSSVFLRFLCAATYSPSLFDLTQELPNKITQRNLTLVTKVLQTMANFTSFQSKENYMEGLNGFIKDKQHEVKWFINTISEHLKEDIKVQEYKGYIDFAKQLALLHQQLFPTLSNCEDKNNLQLHRLLEAMRKVESRLVYNPRPSPCVQRQVSTPAISVGKISSRHHPTTCHGLPYNHCRDRSNSVSSNINCGDLKLRLHGHHSPNSSEHSLNVSNMNNKNSSVTDDELWCHQDFPGQEKLEQPTQEKTESPYVLLTDRSDESGNEAIILSRHHSSSSINSVSPCPSQGDEMRYKYLAARSPGNTLKRKDSSKTSTSDQCNDKTEFQLMKKRLENLETELDKCKGDRADLLSIIQGVTTRHPDDLSEAENKIIQSINALN